jgi:ATP-dependent Clp protease ATP-binding subunit ClpA
LQILEDGGLTDADGFSVYFTQCVVIFTSSLGIFQRNGVGGTSRQLVEPGTPYAVLADTIINAIREYFTVIVGRPELMDRIGNKIIVFDFVSRSAQVEIFESHFDQICERLRKEFGLWLELEPAVASQLRDLCTGGDGHGTHWIADRLEEYLINPLSRVLFDGNTPRDAHVKVAELSVQPISGVDLLVEVSP